MYSALNSLRAARFKVRGNGDNIAHQPVEVGKDVGVDALQNIPTLVGGYEIRGVYVPVAVAARVGDFAVYGEAFRYLFCVCVVHGVPLAICSLRKLYFTVKRM